MKAPSEDQKEIPAMRAQLDHKKTQKSASKEV